MITGRWGDAAYSARAFTSRRAIAGPGWPKSTLHPNTTRAWGAEDASTVGSDGCTLELEQMPYAPSKRSLLAVRDRIGLASLKIQRICFSSCQ